MEITWKNSNGQMKFIMCHTKIKLLTREKYQRAGRAQEENFRAYENKLTHQTN